MIGKQLAICVSKWKPHMKRFRPPRADFVSSAAAHYTMELNAFIMAVLDAHVRTAERRPIPTPRKVAAKQKPNAGHGHAIVPLSYTTKLKGLPIGE